MMLDLPALALILDAGRQAAPEGSDLRAVLDAMTKKAVWVLDARHADRGTDHREFVRLAESLRGGGQ